MSIIDWNKVLLITWVAFVIMGGFFFDYGVNRPTGDYSTWVDIHVMVHVGFGFLMAFMHTYSYSTVGYGLLVGSFSTVFAIFSNTLFLNASKGVDSPIWIKKNINIDTFVDADFCAASVLISFGAVIGRTTISQSLVMTIFQVIFYSINWAVTYNNFGLADIGGSLTIHLFGAVFGVSASYVLGKRRDHHSKPQNIEISHNSNTLAMVGTLFLWCFWPSFNSYYCGPQNSAFSQRAAVNTNLSIISSCVITFFASKFWNNGKFQMMDIQNATLAGGVVMGATANMLITPGGAMALGTIAGIVSATGFNRILPFMERRLGIPDTCGVTHLHGIPGFISAIVSIILTGVSSQGAYNANGMSITDVWPQAGFRDTTGFQAASLFLTIGVALTGGVLAGLAMSLMSDLPIFFDDSHEFVVPKEMMETELKSVASLHQLRPKKPADGSA